MAKGSLKSRLDGSSLDLSLNELTEPPVKELAELPKAVKLDLSCNKITALPDAFCALTHLKELDLSKNQLRELPANFGRLNALHKLDLYGNNLTTLPLSMCRMKALRWLDLKGNPLEPRLKAVAGDCLNEKQCLQCAKKVVEYLQAQESELEREKQKHLRAQREQEALRKAEEEKEAERQRLEKKAEREKKKAELRQKKEQQFKQKQELMKEMEVSQGKLQQSKKDGKASTKSAPGNSKRGGCFSMLMTLLITLLLLAASLFSAVVVYSFYKHKYPITWPYVQDVVHQHWRPVQLYLLQGWDLASVQVQLWTNEIIRVVQSLGAVKAKN
ncbi:uncharacterized protein [Dermacentor andersoni]|uniref:uncharacterized protein n=1 Tax=Dermacentor andersoni TaxID=34620 RepID=UPI002416EA62|nr:leucine-rich repeat-containing protein 59-like [Dermacentor andersoni]